MDALFEPRLLSIIAKAKKKSAARSRGVSVDQLFMSCGRRVSNQVRNCREIDGKTTNPRDVELDGAQVMYLVPAASDDNPHEGRRDEANGNHDDLSHLRARTLRIPRKVACSVGISTVLVDDENEGKHVPMLRESVE